MLWYVPTWNGDIRFEAETDERTVVKVLSPTAAERTKLVALSRLFIKEQWCDRDLWDPKGDDVQVTVVKAPLLTVAQHILVSYRPENAALTAIRFADDHVEAFEAGTGFWAKIRHALTDEVPSRVVEPARLDGEPETTPYRQEQKEKKKKPKAKPEAAATVKRPTPCCPQCHTGGAVGPATEALLAFLTPEQHEQWRERRCILVVGNLTGHRYLIAHRHSALAAEWGKICYDVDDNFVLHFHDWSVPPEEEVLAAKLILEHHEAWLRNEATCFCGDDVAFFKNPFGDSMDGVDSTSFTVRLGSSLRRLEGVAT